MPYLVKIDPAINARRHPGGHFYFNTFLRGFIQPAPAPWPTTLRSAPADPPPL